MGSRIYLPTSRHANACAGTTAACLAPNKIGQLPFLGSAQKKRVEELKNDLNWLRALPIKAFSSEQGVALGALMELECEKRVSHYFISPSLGGETLKIEETSIQIISQNSPISTAAFGLNQDDSFELETPRGLKVYNIVSLQ